ncbi:MAG: helix-turn-helix domain-containing protein [Clostridia bacterium]
MRKYNNKSNISGKIIEQYREELEMSRDELASQLQLLGINIDRTSILRIENNQVILKDFELIAICKILKINYKDLENELNTK